jgi:hypothetical protein
MRTLGLRTTFIEAINACRCDKKMTLADELHMAGLLIRWLEDTVESPPRRPGATPEERADDCLFACCVLAEKLKEGTSLASRLSQQPLLPSLARPAQSAWRRLMTTHLPHLPPAARALLYMALFILEPEVQQDSTLQVAVRDFEQFVTSGDLVLDLGRGRRGAAGEMVTNLAFSLPVGTLGRHFNGSFVGPPRLLTLVFYGYLSRLFDPKHRGIKLEDASEASTE